MKMISANFTSSRLRTRPFERRSWLYNTGYAGQLVPLKPYSHKEFKMGYFHGLSNKLKELDNDTVTEQPADQASTQQDPLQLAEHEKAELLND